jgi:hypothetical protein
MLVFRESGVAENTSTENCMSLSVFPEKFPGNRYCSASHEIHIHAGVEE